MQKISICKYVSIIHFPTVINYIFHYVLSQFIFKHVHLSRLSGQHTETFQLLGQGHPGRGHLSPVGWLHSPMAVSTRHPCFCRSPVKGREPKIISPINICIILAFLVAARATNHLVRSFGAGISNDVIGLSQIKI